MNKNAQNVPMTMKKAYTRVGLSMLVFYGVLSAVSMVTLVAALAIAFFGRGNFSAEWLRQIISENPTNILKDFVNVMNDSVVTDAVLYGSVAGSIIGFPIGLLVMKAVLPKFKQAPEQHELGFGQMLMVFIMGFGLWGVGAVLGNLPSFFGIEMISDYTEGASDAALLVYILYAIIGAPILEELVFRKTLLDRTHGYGQVVAVFVTALLFGLIHGNPAQFPLAFMLGLLLGTVYVKTGHVLYTMLMHFLINFTASIPELLYTINGTDISRGWNVIIPGLIVAGIAFIIIFRKNDLLKLKKSYNPKANPDTFKNVGMILAIIGGGVLVVSSVGLSIVENLRVNGPAALWTLVPIGVSAATIILVPLTVGRHYLVRVVHHAEPAAPTTPAAPPETLYAPVDPSIRAGQPFVPAEQPYEPQQPFMQVQRPMTPEQPFYTAPEQPEAAMEAVEEKVEEARQDIEALEEQIQEDYRRAQMFAAQEPPASDDLN